MMLFHRNCVWPRVIARFLLRRISWRGVRAAHQGIARMRLRQSPDDVVFAVRSYRCGACGAVVHVDMDWAEGAIAEPRATLE